jgi:hypothetical protein
MKTKKYLVQLNLSKREFDVLLQAVVRYGRISQLNKDAAGDRICAHLLALLDGVYLLKESEDLN